MALTIVLIFASCKKEDTLGNGTQFRATMEGCTAAKTALNGTAIEWVSGDQIAVYGTAGCGIYSATPQTPATVAVFDNVSGETGNGPFRAYYPATLTTDGVNITLPATQTYVEGSINEFPMYAESGDNQLAFKNLCGVLKLHLTKANTSISTIHITAASEINGTFSIDFNGGAPELSHVSGGSSTITLTCATAQNITDGKDFYIYLPAGSYSGLEINIMDADGKVCTKISKSTTTVNVARSQYTIISFSDNDLLFLTPGALTGLFSVSATKQVRFSRGSLQYTTEGTHDVATGGSGVGTWRFAENQFDIVGDNITGTVYKDGVKCNNQLKSSTYTGWIDIFGFATSGWCGCMPWATTSDVSYYRPNGSSSASLTGSYANGDWGVYNAISNGGDEPGLWRTLTASELRYLLTQRPNATAKRGTGDILGIGGLIILPDDFILPEGLSFTSQLPSSNDWSNNNYTVSEWRRMEAAGAVFLPSMSYSDWDGGVYYYGGAEGLAHWMAHYRTSTSYSSNIAYVMRFNSNTIEPDFSWSWKHHGMTVRLVQDYEED